VFINKLLYMSSTTTTSSAPALSRLFLKRIQGDVKDLDRNRMEFVQGIQDENNIKLFYFMLRPRESPYIGGLFIGKIELPDDYPKTPGSFYMLTPNGRFAINSKICLTNSSYHRESWTPIWSIRNMIVGISSIFVADDTNGISHIKDTKEQRERYSQESIEYNLIHYGDIFKRFNFYINSDGTIKSDDEVLTIINTNKVKLTTPVSEQKPEPEQVSEQKPEPEPEQVSQQVSEQKPEPEQVSEQKPEPEQVSQQVSQQVSEQKPEPEQVSQQVSEQKPEQKEKVVEDKPKKVIKRVVKKKVDNTISNDIQQDNNIVEKIVEDKPKKVIKRVVKKKIDNTISNDIQQDNNIVEKVVDDKPKKVIKRVVKKKVDNTISNDIQQDNNIVGKVIEDKVIEEKPKKVIKRGC
jgi:ubiquitin-conjugating enzyme E2 J2